MISNDYLLLSAAALFAVLLHLRTNPPFPDPPAGNLYAAVSGRLGMEIIRLQMDDHRFPDHFLGMYASCIHSHPRRPSGG